jgi:hypothetical protein
MPRKTKRVSAKSEERRRYARMVRAVREWLAVAHPTADLIDIVEYESMDGCGSTLAAFHGASDNPYTRGDEMAGCRC